MHLYISLNVMAFTCHPSTGETEAWRVTQDQGLGGIVRPSLKK